MPEIFDNRESWLESAVEELQAEFSQLHTAEPVRVTCGFPSRSALGRRTRRIGECWDGTAAADNRAQLSITPLLADPVEVLAVLVHELVHAAVGCEHGHKAPFKRVATDVGLEGKMTATVAGEGLRQRLNAIADRLGPYPHVALKPVVKERPGSRLLRAECPACGTLIRVTQKVVDSPGLPFCACDGETRFTVGGADGE